MAVYARWKREAMVRFPSFPTRFLMEVRLMARRLTVNEHDEGSSPLLPANFDGAVKYTPTVYDVATES
jgi:hypothetical protein